MPRRLMQEIMQEVQQSESRYHSHSGSQPSDPDSPDFAALATSNNELVTCVGYKVYAVTSTAVRIGLADLDERTHLTDRMKDRLKAWIPLAFIKQSETESATPYDSTREYGLLYEVNEIGNFQIPRWVAAQAGLEFVTITGTPKGCT